MVKKTVKISRGYRLKPSTHKLIKSLESIAALDTDTILSNSCKLFLKTLMQNEKTAAKIKQ
jgi:hypothetical protein